MIRKRPERVRSAAITWVTWRPMSPPPKSGRAIGSGSTVPWVMSISISAAAGVAAAAAMPRAVATAAMVRRREAKTRRAPAAGNVVGMVGISIIDGGVMAALGGNAEWTIGRRSRVNVGRARISDRPPRL